LNELKPVPAVLDQGCRGALTPAEPAHVTTRRRVVKAQLSPTLSEPDLQRLTRFGEKRSYRDGQLLFEVGRRGPHEAWLSSGVHAYLAELAEQRIARSDAQPTSGR
jgi:hypothetical protein